MLTLQNINNSLIKVSSPKLEELLQNPSSYISLQIEASVNCCEDSVVDKTIEFSPLDTVCSVCDNTYAWRLDLTNIANLNREVKKIWVKNIVTGIEYNILDTPISFQSFIETCGDGSCTLESIILYQTLFYNAFNDWFSANVQWFNTTVGFCGNTLTVCRLPNNFIVTRIEYQAIELESLYFSFNETEESLILNDSLYLTPKFFGLEVFEDGIYKVKIRVTNDEGSWTEETNCFFMDIKTKCKVSRFIEKILKKDEVANNIHLIHYALTNASNCGCNCEEMCELYKYLVKLLGDKTVNVNNCGC